MTTTEDAQWNGSPKTWARTIKDRRMALAMNHDELAAEAGIRTDRLVKLEKAHASCTEAEYKRVLKILEKTLPEKPTLLLGSVGIPSTVALPLKQALGMTDAEVKLVEKKVEIAIKIRDKRKEKRISPEDFASALGSNVNQVSKLEHAHSSCTLADLESALEIMKWF